MANQHVKLEAPGSNAATAVGGSTDEGPHELIPPAASHLPVTLPKVRPQGAVRSVAICGPRTDQKMMK
jgi:hypothetical protein